MHLESPAFKRCCLCIPLRRGLIGWGYVRLVVGILAFTLFTSELANRPAWPHSKDFILISVCLCCVELWDITFNLILIVAGHKKSAKLLKVSFILGLVWIVMFLACGLFVLYWEIRRVIDYWYFYHYIYYILYGPLIIISITFLNTFVHVYVMLMIRSEEKKLRNQSGEMQFVNNAAEGEAACVYASAPTAARTTNMTHEDEDVHEECMHKTFR